MRQDAGLRLKCLGGRLAWGRWPISLVYGATEWSCYGLRDVFKFMPPRKSALLTRGGSRICGWQSHSPLTQWSQRTTSTAQATAYPHIDNIYPSHRIQ